MCRRFVDAVRVQPKGKRGKVDEAVALIGKLYSLVQTAKANGLEPYAWLRRVLRDLPVAKTVEEVEALLSWNLRIPDLSGETVG